VRRLGTGSFDTIDLSEICFVAGTSHRGVGQTEHDVIDDYAAPGPQLMPPNPSHVLSK